MTRRSGQRTPPLQSTPLSAGDRDRLLTTEDTADLLRLSTSWLAKARMRGDGPPFVKLGGSVRYVESSVVRWMRAQQRLSTTDRSW
jgi:predicted DNA-binding transcriptional regulator AlpA